VNPLWDYFWPIFAAGVVIGAFTGHIAYRQLLIIGRRSRLAGKTLIQEWRRTRRIYFGGGAAAALAAAALWSGPLGGGDRLAGKIEAAARATLNHLEMTQVRARLERGPLRRRLVLSGPADDFQRAELVQILDDIRGVKGVRWATEPMPLAKPSAGAQ
jgi:hypothetical protein